jgi:hypothetical protein
MSRELDRKIAEKVFGLHYPPEHQQHDDGWTFCNWSDGHPLRQYSELIQEAFLVVEKMREKYWEFQLGRDDNHWYCEFVLTQGGLNPIISQVEKMTFAPEAICRAALAALKDS